MVKQTKLRKAPAAQSFRGTIRFKNHARAAVHQEYGVGYHVHDVAMPDHRSLRPKVSIAVIV